MRIMFFIPLLSTKGGQERTLTDKANFLVESGHDIMFVTYEHEGSLAYPLASAVKHVDMNCHFFTLYKYPIYRRWLEALKLKRIFRQKMKGVFSRFRPDVIVITIPNTENLIWDVIKVAAGIPVIIESHLAQGYQVIRRGITEKWLYYLYNPVRAVKKADLLITLTEGDAACWRKLGVKNVKVIPNPVTYYPNQIAEAKKVDGRIICVGRLTHQKRFDRLIDAFSLLAVNNPDWHVEIYGAGEELERLQAQLLDCKLSERIHLLPPTSDIYTEYQRSQFFVLSSDFEGFGLVIAEAMACALPVIVTDCPFGPSEIVEDGVTGLLSKMDVQDLATKMEWMMTHPAERKLMGQKAYMAVARYQKNKVIPEWERAYMNVIKQ